jgi:hypothetical protein
VFQGIRGARISLGAYAQYCSDSSRLRRVLIFSGECHALWRFPPGEGYRASRSNTNVTNAHHIIPLAY